MIMFMHLKRYSAHKSMMKLRLSMVIIARRITLLWGGKGISKLATCTLQTS